MPAIEAKFGSMKFRWPEDHLELEARVRALVQVLARRGLTQEEWEQAVVEAKEQMVKESGGVLSMS